MERAEIIPKAESRSGTKRWGWRNDGGKNGEDRGRQSSLDGNDARQAALDVLPLFTEAGYAPPQGLAGTHTVE
jgi:hypothetical protein